MCRETTTVALHVVRPGYVLLRVDRLLEATSLVLFEEAAFPDADADFGFLLLFETGVEGVDDALLAAVDAFADFEAFDGDADADALLVVADMGVAAGAIGLGRLWARVAVDTPEALGTGVGSPFFRRSIVPSLTSFSFHDKRMLSARKISS